MTKTLSYALWRTAAAVKQFTMQFVRSGARWGMSVLLGLTNINYAAIVGDGRGNAIVVACVLWMCRTFPESPLRVQKLVNGEWEYDDEHPLFALLQRPNRFYSGILLIWGALADWAVTGNGYWLKGRSSASRTVELWWAPSFLVEPRWPEDGSAFISHYEYSPNGRPERIEIEDVVHLRYGLDPQNTRKGLSPIASLVREIFTDDEAANFSATLLKNLGVPGVIVSPAAGVKVEQPDADMIKAQFEQRFGGDNRGRVMVASKEVTTTVLSFSPQQMDLKALRRLPEERVSAIFGTPAVVVGLGAGLDRSTFANMAEAREAAYESNIIPTQRLWAAELNNQLVGDFGDQKRLRLVFDLSQVRVLQQDENALHQRIRDDVAGGVLTVNEGRQALGLEPLPGADVLYVPGKVKPTDPADLLTEPEPVPLLSAPVDDDEDESMKGQRTIRMDPGAWNNLSLRDLWGTAEGWARSDAIFANGTNGHNHHDTKDLGQPLDDAGDPDVGPEDVDEIEELVRATGGQRAVDFLNAELEDGDDDV